MMTGVEIKAPRFKGKRVFFKFFKPSHHNKNIPHGFGPVPLKAEDRYVDTKKGYVKSKLDYILLNANPRFIFTV